jgi:hypothetical protein
MKRYLILILLATLVLTSNLLIACASQEKQPDPRLIELQQIKLGQIEQIDALLTNLRAEIQDIESELAQPVEMKALHNMTAEEIAASFRRPGLEARLTLLKEQEADLLARKQYLEEDLKGIEALLEEE